MSRDDDDEIGYGKPPRYTQFRKGKSGNPNGRPRKQKAAAVLQSTEYDDMVREVSAEKLLVKRGGKTQKISASEAVLLRQRQDALAGSVTAQREHLRAKERVDERDALRAQAAEEERVVREALEAEDALNRYNYLVSLHAEQLKVYELAEAAGMDPSPRYPHPDDFVFDHRNQEATIIGPWDEEDARHFMKLAKQRDYHLIDHLILSRQRPRGSRFQLWLAAFNMNNFNLMLPRHQQLADEGLNDMLTILLRLPMADLRDWRRDLDLWLKLNPQPQPGKKARKETYKFVNALMNPMLKDIGFLSLAQLDRHYEEEEAKAGQVAVP